MHFLCYVAFEIVIFVLVHLSCCFILYGDSDSYRHGRRFVRGIKSVMGVSNGQSMKRISPEKIIGKCSIRSNVDLKYERIIQNERKQ